MIRKKTPTPAGHWEFLANDLLIKNQSSLAQAAHTFVQLNIAMTDAFIAAWQAKYTYNLLRPVTYIQLALESSWTPSLMPTPPFPEYPSGPSVQSSAAAVILNQRFGANSPFVDNTHNDRGWGHVHSKILTKRPKKHPSPAFMQAFITAMASLLGKSWVLA
jgi:hypothetical protein